MEEKKSSQSKDQHLSYNENKDIGTFRTKDKKHHHFHETESLPRLVMRWTITKRRKARDGRLILQLAEQGAWYPSGIDNN